MTKNPFQSEFPRGLETDQIDKFLAPRHEGSTAHATPPQATKPKTGTQQTIPDQIEELRKQLRKLEADNKDLQRDLAEECRERQEAERAAAHAEEREDSWLQERAKLRARVRRRELDELERAAHKTRLEAIRSLKALLPKARSEAKKGKPALLRLILRSTR